MNITVLPYIDETALEKSKTTDTSRTQTPSASHASFDATLDAAKKALTLMAVDAAIVEAKRSGADGLTLNSEIANLLGITDYAGSAGTASASSSVSETAAGSTNTASAAANTAAASSSDTLSCSEELNSYFKEAAEKYQVDINLLKSIAKAESNFNAGAQSSAGAMGIMQLMPSTASELGITDAYNAYDNIMGGAKLISQLLDKYSGNTSLALAAYNAGSGNVDKYGGIPPFTETQNYVTKVLGYFQG